MENEGKKKRAGKNINKYIIIISPTWDITSTDFLFLIRSVLFFYMKTDITTGC
jgi:hypothetical protein